MMHPNPRTRRGRSKRTEEAEVAGVAGAEEEVEDSGAAEDVVEEEVSSLE